MPRATIFGNVSSRRVDKYRGDWCFLDIGSFLFDLLRVGNIREWFDHFARCKCRHERMFLWQMVGSSIALWALSLGTSDRAENIARSYREFLRTIDSCGLCDSGSQPCFYNLSKFFLRLPSDDSVVFNRLPRIHGLDIIFEFIALNVIRS